MIVSGVGWIGRNIEPIKTAEIATLKINPSCNIDIKDGHKFNMLQ